MSVLALASGPWGSQRRARGTPPLVQKAASRVWANDQKALRPRSLQATMLVRDLLAGRLGRKLGEAQMDPCPRLEALERARELLSGRSSVGDLQVV